MERVISDRERYIKELEQERGQLSLKLTKLSADAARCLDAETCAQQLEEDVIKLKSENRLQRKRIAELQGALANGRAGEATNDTT